MPSNPFALSVKVVILDHEGHCLLLKRSPHDRAYPGKWDFPGGKVGPGEKFDEALLRETREETRLDISLQRLAAALEFEIYAIRVVCIIMEARLKSGQVNLSHEHSDFAWVAPVQLPAMDLAEPFVAFARTYAKINVLGRSPDFKENFPNLSGCKREPAVSE